MRYRFLMDVSPSLRKGAVRDFSRSVITGIAKHQGVPVERLCIPEHLGQSYDELKEEQRLEALLDANDS